MHPPVRVDSCERRTSHSPASGGGAAKVSDDSELWIAAAGTLTREVATEALHRDRAGPRIERVAAQAGQQCIGEWTARIRRIDGDEVERLVCR